MHVHQTDNPAQTIAHQITETLREYQGTPVLLLLSGGSALSVLDCIDPTVLHANLTVMMGDERFSNDPKINNYVQLTNTKFHTELQSRGGDAISSLPDTSVQSTQDFAYGINKLLSYYLKTHLDAVVIALLGMGSDGHTASIFPHEKEEEFNTIYRTTDLYVDTPVVGEPAVERLTISPYFIKNHIDKIFLYAVGESKRKKLSELMLGDADVYALPVAIVAQHANAHLYTDQTI